MLETRTLTLQPNHSECDVSNQVFCFPLNPIRIRNKFGFLNFLLWQAGLASLCTCFCNSRRAFYFLCSPGSIDAQITIKVGSNGLTNKSHSPDHVITTFSSGFHGEPISDFPLLLPSVLILGVPLHITSLIAADNLIPVYITYHFRRRGFALERHPPLPRTCCCRPIWELCCFIQHTAAGVVLKRYLHYLDMCLHNTSHLCDYGAHEPCHACHELQC